MWSNLDSTTSYEGGFLDDSRKDQLNDEEKKLKRIQTIVPVMIKHLLSVPSTEEVKLWGIPARIFTIVGIIRHVEETTTKISYDVEDETGTISALKWLEADKKVTDPLMQVDNYIRVFGLLREQNDKRHLLILRIWALEDLNELTNHILEVTYAMLKAEAMATNGGKNVKKATTVDNGISDKENTPYYGMTADQTLVYNIIHAENHTESGIERSEIKGRVPRTILSRVDEILDFLVSEGHIYTTSTEDHFKST